MKKSNLYAYMAASLMLGISQLSLAAVVVPASTFEGTIEFTNPTGTVLPTDSIDIYVTLTNTSTSTFTYDESVDGFGGLDPANFPATGDDYSNNNFGVPFDSYDQTYAFTGWSCDSSFDGGCGVGEYDYAPASTADDWFTLTANGFTLNPGASQDILLYRLTPTDGTATPGTYFAYSMGLGIGVSGMDANGNTLDGTVFELDTCQSGDPNCSFSRTVVPVPAAAWLFLSALGVFGYFGRTRRNAV